MDGFLIPGSIDDSFPPERTLQRSVILGFLSPSGKRCGEEGEDDRE